MGSIQSSAFQSDKGCPTVYEELIQNLEQEVRKHIRIEQKLKLHIESVEQKVEELEKEQTAADSFDKEAKNMAQESELKQKQVENLLVKLKDIEKAKHD